MFTGIVEELGRVKAVTVQTDGARLVIEATQVLDDASTGSSIAVNGCCLTVTEFSKDRTVWSADVVNETLERTCLGALVVGDPVNLERPLRLTDRLGGHIVQGHVDGVGFLRERNKREDGSAEVAIEAPSDVLRFVIAQGSIAIDGVSLTVVAVDQDVFRVAIIPHTAQVTTLGLKPLGATVNLEVDVLAKYVERLLSSSVPTAG